MDVDEYNAIETMTNEQLQEKFDGVWQEIWERLEPNYTMEENPIQYLLAYYRELTLREGK